MKKSLLGILVVILAVSIVSSGSSAAEKIRLQLRLEEGRAYSIQMIVNQEISQTIQGQQQEMTQTIGLGYIFKVEEMEAEGDALVKVTYHSALFKHDGPVGTFEYDSSNPPAEVPLLARGFAALVGQSFSMKISPDGHIKDVQGMNAMLSHILEKLDLPEGTMKTSLEKSLREQFGAQGLKESMETMMAIYPNQPVGIGDSWTERTVISRGLPMILDNTWTLKERKNGLAIIEVSSIVKPNPEAAPMEWGPARLTYDISGKQKGTIELEEATGWTTSGKLTQQFSGQIKAEGGGQIPEGMSWPISIESVISFKSFEKQ